MPDLEALRADADAAQAFSAMARRRLLDAQASLAARASRWKARSEASTSNRPIAAAAGVTLGRHSRSEVVGESKVLPHR
jgi:hypothetical protein